MHVCIRRVRIDTCMYVCFDPHLKSMHVQKCFISARAVTVHVHVHCKLDLFTVVSKLVKLILQITDSTCIPTASSICAC